jgi:hypothetical protein
MWQLYCRLFQLLLLLHNALHLRRACVCSSALEESVAHVHHLWLSREAERSGCPAQSVFVARQAGSLTPLAAAAASSAS